jgi:hypothetical protein
MHDFFKDTLNRRLRKVTSTSSMRHKGDSSCLDLHFPFYIFASVPEYKLTEHYHTFNWMLHTFLYPRRYNKIVISLVVNHLTPRVCYCCALG